MVFNLMEVAGQIVLDGCPCQFYTIVCFYSLVLENLSALDVFLFCCCCYSVEVKQEFSDIVTAVW